LQRVAEFSRRTGRPPVEQSLNQLAYARALAKTDLDKALADIDEAIDLVPNADKPAKSTQLERTAYYEKGLFLDTRGYIHYLQGDYPAALDDLTEALKRAGVQPTPKPSAAAKSDAAVKSDGAVKSDATAADSGLVAGDSAAARARGAAVIYYHRSLVLDALDRKVEAARDRYIARQLIGREPDETLF